MSYFNHMYLNNQARSRHIRFSAPPIIRRISTQTFLVEKESSGSKAMAFIGSFLGAIGSGALCLLNKASETQTTTATTTTTGGVDKLKNLRDLFSKYIFADEGDGKYTVNDGKNVFTGTYDEILAHCEKLQQAQGTTTPTATDPNQDPAPKPEPATHEDQTAVGASDLKDGINLTVMDEERNGVGNITGDLKISKEVDATSKFPKRLLVDGRRYEFQKVDTDGKAIYKSSQGGQNYKAEWKDGECVLTQRTGLENTDQTGTPDFSESKTTRYTSP